MGFIMSYHHFMCGFSRVRCWTWILDGKQGCNGNNRSGSTGNRQCRAHGLQNARSSCGEVNVRSRAYPLNTSDLWRFWRTFLDFCCGAYVFRYQRLLRGFALLL